MQMTVVLISIHLGLARTVHIYTVYDRIFGNIPVKNTGHTPYTKDSGQIYIHQIQ
jgi:hypothetical protein